MHPRIQELFGLIKDISTEKVLNKEVLHLLKDYGATRTEASIMFHLGFNIEPKKADQFVIESGIWENEDLNEVFYQTLKYLYYDPNDPNYDVGEDTVQVSI